LPAFHRGSHLEEYFIPKVSFRPGFLGRGLHGRYPPSPVPVQGCTSHPGHNAGRHDAQAAREQAANPPAGTALAPMTRCASAPCPSRSEDCNVTGLGTTVKMSSPKKIRRSSASHHNVRFTPDSDRLLRCRVMTLWGNKQHPERLGDKRFDKLPKSRTLKKFHWSIFPGRNDVLPRWMRFHFGLHEWMGSH
jgi:hypothetical protein